MAKCDATKTYYCVHIEQGNIPGIATVTRAAVTEACTWLVSRSTGQDRGLLGSYLASI